MPVRSKHSNLRNRKLSQGIGAGLAVMAWSFASIGSVAQAQMPTTTLTSVFPPSAQAGTEIEVQIRGEDLDEVSGLQFSHPGITAEQKMTPPDEFSEKPTPAENQFVVKVGGDVPAGTYEVRGVGRFGISNPRAFVVDDLKQVEREGPADSREEAMPVEIGSAVVAQMANQRKEYYSIELKKNDRVLIDCWCERIDSRMDPVVSLFDPNGRMVRRARQADPRDTLIHWDVQTDGPHIVMVHDFTYDGGADYAYRLSFRKAPYLDFVFPPVGKPGSNEEYTVYGRNLPGGKPAEGMEVRGVPLEKKTVKIPLPSDPESLNRLPMTGTVDSFQASTSGHPYRLKGPDGLSNAVTVHFADAPVVLEEEPANDQPESAQNVSVPCEYVGQFYPKRDRDWLSFEAKKGDVYWINMISQRLGTFADPVLMIERVTQDDKGNEEVRKITTQDDAPYEGPGRNEPDLVSLKTDDPQYRLEADRDATYRIRINDLYNNPAGDPRLVYRLVIQKAKPDFQLVAYVEPEKDRRNEMKPTACVVRRGGTQAVKLNLARQYGFEGDVSVRVEGLPDGVTCQGAEFGGQVEKGWLVFEAAENAKPWAGPIRIIAEAQVDGKTIEREARYGTLLWPLDRNSAVSCRLARNLTLSVVTAETSPVVLEAGDGKIIETALGAKFEVPLKVTKRESIKGDLKVSAVDLHRDISSNDVTVKNDSGKAEIELRSDNIPLGTYTFYFQGQSQFKYKRNQDAVKKAKEEVERAKKLKEKYEKEAQEAKKKADEAAQKAKSAEDELKAAQKTAEEAKKAAAEAAKKLAEAEKQLAEAKKAAEQNQDDKSKAEAVQKAEKALAEMKQQHEEAAKKKTEAETALKAAEEKNQSAQKAQKEAETAQKSAEEMAKKADNYAKKANDELKDVTNKNKESDINLYVVSTPVKMRVHSHPLKITAPSTLGKLQPEKSLELPISIERLYGFEDDVTVELDLPAGVKGISAKNVQIKKGKTESKMTVQAGKDLTPGRHEATLRFRMRFNRVNAEAEQPIIIEAEAPKEVAGK